MRILKFGNAQIGTALKSLRSALERKNQTVVPLVDSTAAAVETTNPGFHYRTTAIVTVQKPTEDAFQAYVNGVLKPALRTGNSATLAEFETLPTATLKRSQADARCEGIEFLPPDEVPQTNIWSRDYGIRISFTSPNDLTEAP